MERVITDKAYYIRAYSRPHKCASFNLLIFWQDFCDLHVEALQVVVNFLTDSESLHLIHQDGGLTRLMEFFLTPNISEVQCSAVECITRVAHSRKHRSRKDILIFFSFRSEIRRVFTLAVRAFRLTFLYACVSGHGSV